MTFTEIANNVSVMYALLLIIILLMIIAFKEKPWSRRASKNT